MELFEYQKFAKTTETDSLRALTPTERMTYFALGLGGEAGEVLEKVKKIIRDCGGIPCDDEMESATYLALTMALRRELGDVMWYWAELCNTFGWSGDVVLLENIDKLKSRVERNVVHGSGDER